MHESNTRREQTQRNTQREIEIERERRNFEIIQLFVGGGSGLDITASERKVVSASEREIERERERVNKEKTIN